VGERGLSSIKYEVWKVVLVFAGVGYKGCVGFGERGEDGGGSGVSCSEGS
jgi:hypothetical protein